MKRALFLAALACMFAGGCAKIHYDALGEDISMGKATGRYETVGRFEHSSKAMFLVLSLITVKDAELEDAARNSIARHRGDAIVNLEIVEQTDFLDIVVGIVVGGILNTRNVEFRGDVVRYLDSSGSVPTLEEELALAVEAFNASRGL